MHPVTLVTDNALRIPSLPRYQSGNQPQQVLAALVADFDFADAGPVTSASIIELLTVFGVTEAAARSALSRVVGRGLLLQHRDGRRVTYTVNRDGLDDRNERLRYYVSSAAHDIHWDGQWTVVVFSVPDTHRALRPRLRNALEQLHLRPLTDAVWVHPSDLTAQALKAADELGVALTALRSRALPARNDALDPVTAFDLDDIRALYDEFRMEFAPLAEAIARGSVTPEQALIGRVSCLNRWRRIISLDPTLPAELLPADWPRRAAYDLFLATWGALGPLALSTVSDIVARYDPETAPRLRYFS